MTTKQYDIIILGAGCAGMQLLHAFISHKNYANESILIIDGDEAYQQSKSWCFWHTLQNHPYESIIHKKWNNISIGYYNQIKIETIQPYQYCYIKSEDFYQYHFQIIKENPNVTYLKNKVLDIEKNNGKFLIYTENAIHSTNMLYTSYWNKHDINLNENIFLKQQFYGWEIETEQPVFNDSTATMMDFNIKQTDGVNFAYVLPINKSYALVEITTFCAKDYTINFFEEVLQEYLNSKWNTSFIIKKVEHASIPMTNFIFNRFSNNGAITIGTAAGMVKPTTGYAFNRILKDSNLLTNAFFDKKIPDNFSKNRFNFYDKLLLKLLDESPAKALHILITLFKKTPFKTVLKFLDEDTSISNEVLLFLQLPKKDFLKQLF